MAKPAKAEDAQPAALTRAHASAFAKLALKGANKEYPYKPGVVLAGPADVKPPKEFHPAFHGCFDWHSAVHGHWLLVKVLRTHPTLPEAKQIRARTRQFNEVLRAEADRLGWAWVDANAFLTRVDRRGYAIPGVGTLTTEYLGGIFSLDGVHPTDTGQALVAKLVVEAINETYGTDFAPPDVAAIAAADPQTCNARR